MPVIYQIFLTRNSTSFTSNSVIEHVGNWGDMSCYGYRGEASCGTLFRPKHPIIGFQWNHIIAPHFSSTCLKNIEARLLMSRRHGFRGPVRTLSEGMYNVQSVRLLTSRQLQELFPDATIRREIFFGLTKSLIAVK